MDRNTPPLHPHQGPSQDSTPINQIISQINQPLLFSTQGKQIVDLARELAFHISLHTMILTLVNQGYHYVDAFHEAKQQCPPVGHLDIIGVLQGLTGELFLENRNGVGETRSSGQLMDVTNSSVPGSVHDGRGVGGNPGGASHMLGRFLNDDGSGPWNPVGQPSPHTVVHDLLQPPVQFPVHSKPQLLVPESHHANTDVVASHFGSIVPPPSAPPPPPQDQPSQGPGGRMTSEDGSTRPENSGTNRCIRCTRCGKDFPSQWKLDDHAKKHTRKKEIECRVCKCYFGRERDMRKHVSDSKKHRQNVARQGKKPSTMANGKKRSRSPSFSTVSNPNTGSGATTTQGTLSTTADTARVHASNRSISSSPSSSSVNHAAKRPRRTQKHTNEMLINQGASEGGTSREYQIPQYHAPADGSLNQRDSHYPPPPPLAYEAHEWSNPIPAPQPTIAHNPTSNILADFTSHYSGPDISDMFLQGPTQFDEFDDGAEENPGNGEEEADEELEFDADYTGYHRCSDIYEG